MLYVGALSAVIDVPCWTEKAVPEIESTCGLVAEMTFTESGSSKVMPDFSRLQVIDVPKSVVPVSAKPIFGVDVERIKRDSLSEYSFSDHVESSDSHESVSDVHVPAFKPVAMRPAVPYVNDEIEKMAHVLSIQFQATTVSQFVCP